MPIMPDARNRDMHNNSVIIKPSGDIRLSKLLASQQALREAKSATITLKDFIAENYHFGTVGGVDTAFKCTIRDIGLAPFEIDIYDARIIVVEVTGKFRKDFEGNEVPERVYRGRNNNLSTALHDIASIMGRRKLLAMDSTVVTLRDYHNAFAPFYRYVCNVINKDYGRALDVMQDKFPFTQISEGRSDEEDWFTSK